MVWYDTGTAGREGGVFVCECVSQKGGNHTYGYRALVTGPLRQGGVSAETGNRPHFDQNHANTTFRVPRRRPTIFRDTPNNRRYRSKDVQTARRSSATTALA